MKTSITQNETLFEITCQNKIGACPNSSTIVISTHLKRNNCNFNTFTVTFCICLSASEFVEVHYVDVISTVILEWSLNEGAVFYSIFYCRAENWFKCDSNLTWTKILSEFNEYTFPLNDFSQFVFAVSVCYETGCSAMKIASKTTVDFSKFNSVEMHEEYKQKEIQLKFTSNTFISYYNIILNSPSTVFSNTTIYSNVAVIIVKCEDIGNEKLLLVQVTPYKIMKGELGRRVHKGRDFKFSVRSHCELENRGLINLLHLYSS